MRIGSSAKAVVIGVAAGSVVAVAGIGYAATGSSLATVKACVSSSGRLALLSGKGTCAKGFKVVAINKQGPTGKTGKTGAAGKPGAPGKPGPRGPGAQTLYLNTDDSGDTSPVTIGQFGYQLGCDVATQGADTTVTATVYIIPETGTTASLDTTFSYTTGSSLTPTASTYRATFSARTSFYASIKNNVEHLYVDAMRIVSSDGTVDVLSADVTVDSRATPAGKRCLLQGQVTPSSTLR